MDRKRTIARIVPKIIFLHHGIVVFFRLLFHFGGHAVFDGETDLVVEDTLLPILAQSLFQFVDVDVVLVLQLGGGVAVRFGLSEKTDGILVFQLGVDILFVMNTEYALCTKMLRLSARS